MLIATTGCDTNTSDTSDTDTITSSTDGAIDSGSIVAATVRVRADGCGPRTELGTGTAIADGLVVTAAHVVAGSSRVEVVDRSGTAVAAEVVVFDPELDVAALRPATDVGSPVPLRPVPLRAEMGQQGERGIVAVIDTDGAATPATVEVLRARHDSNDRHLPGPTGRTRRSPRRCQRRARRLRGDGAPPRRWRRHRVESEHDVGRPGVDRRSPQRTPHRVDATDPDRSGGRGPLSLRSCP